MTAAKLPNSRVYYLQPGKTNYSKWKAETDNVTVSTQKCTNYLEPLAESWETA